MTTAVGWAPIVKSEKTADGTLIITGKAADSAVDRDFQIADPEWLDTAMSKWFSAPDGGNVREQHDAKRAVGTAVHYEKRDDGGHYLTAEIVDPVAIMKVEKNVLRGFSWGARNAAVTTDKAAPGGRINRGDIYEVSIVDRPANPGCLFTMAKADDSGEVRVLDEPEVVEPAKETEKADEPSRPEPTFTPTQFEELLKGLGKTPAPADADTIEKKDYSKDERDAAAKDGSAMKDGSFPIKNAADLKNAIGLVGNAKDPKAAKAHVVKRARALNLVDKLPDSWGISKADQIITDLTALIPGALIKADGDAFDPNTEVSDVDAGNSAIACIARLIISEAEGLAAGRMEEIWDIQTLVNAAISLQCFVSSETYQEAELMSDTAKADAATETGTEPATTEPDTAKTETSAEPDAATDTTKTDAGTAPAVENTEATPEGELTKSDLSDLLQETITKAVQPFQERVAALEGELAKVLATPQPGGPARTRTTTQTAVASQADDLRREIAYCEKSIQITGGDMRKGYRERLDTARDELSKLDGAA